MIEAKHRDAGDETLTFFADPTRASAEVLETQIDLACTHPVSTAVMKSFNGLVLILNQYRQAVAVNDAFLRALGVSEPEAALGLRPGEAVGCQFAKSAPNGCGTGKACITCGAVLAIVASRRLQQSIERECLIARSHEGKDDPLEFLVRATPVDVDGIDLTVVTLADISEKKRAQAVERMFIHDLLNCVHGLKGLCEITAEDMDAVKKTEMEQIQDLTDYLCEMANAHRDLLLMENGEFQSVPVEIEIADIVAKVQKVVGFSGVARNKSLVMEMTVPKRRVTTDEVLLVRVLVNMLKNAFEAAAIGEKVSLRCEVSDAMLMISVWNSAQIPEHTALRVFQRYFSTKPGNGRGLGTYSMKLIGERFLGGKVTFDTSESGTTFTLSLPL